jgi:hypothetical protein
MQEPKLIVTGDFIDTNTGIRFVEDIRGNYHCIMQMEVMSPNIEIYETETPIEIPPVIFNSGWITFSPNITLTPEIKISPEVIITVDLAYEKDKEIFDLLNENAWLWGLIQQAIKDKKEKNCSYAMTKLEQAINGGMP